MNHHYSDIRDLIHKSPRWWDEQAVPRYCPFAPDQLANIYADECVLLLISCQNCEREFQVGMSSSRSDVMREFWLQKEEVTEQRARQHSLTGQVESGVIHYGDPPNIECCPSGPSMNCNDLRVLEFWRRDRGDWVRVPELERVLPDGEALPHTPPNEAHHPRDREEVPSAIFVILGDPIDGIVAYDNANDAEHYASDHDCRRYAGPYVPATVLDAALDTVARLTEQRDGARRDLLAAQDMADSLRKVAREAAVRLDGHIYK